MTHHAIERSMLGLTLRDHITIIERCGRSCSLIDGVEIIISLKWNWAGYITRVRGNRGTERIIE